MTLRKLLWIVWDFVFFFHLHHCHQQQILLSHYLRVCSNRWIVLTESSKREFISLIIQQMKTIQWSMSPTKKNERTKLKVFFFFISILIYSLLMNFGHDSMCYFYSINNNVLFYDLLINLYLIQISIWNFIRMTDWSSLPSISLLSLSLAYCVVFYEEKNLWLYNVAFLEKYMQIK
jgi:hypothetical protein